MGRGAVAADVGVAYASGHDLECHVDGSRMKGYVVTLIGDIGGGPRGVMSWRLSGRYQMPLVIARYHSDQWPPIIGGLWVARSGQSLWKRVALRKGYLEIHIPNERFSAGYRVAVRSAEDEAPARRLLTPPLVEWLGEAADDGARVIPRDRSFELEDGTLSIRGPLNTFEDESKLDDFATAAGRIASAAVDLLRPSA